MRDKLGARLFELFHFQVLQLGVIHADPHWGNYLFTDDAGIGLVDFGCVKHLRPEIVTYLRGVSLYTGATDSAEFRRLLERTHEQLGAKLLPATRRAFIHFVEDFYRHMFPQGPDKAPLFDFGDAAFLRDYVQAGRNFLGAKGLLAEFIFLVRAEMGLYHTLHRLRARVPTSQIVRKYL